MASSDSTGLYIFGFIILLVIGFFAYGYLNKRITADKRKQLVMTFKASPAIVKNAPILVQGAASAPDVLIPTTGEHVAYYGLFILSGETVVTETRTGIDLRVNGIPLDPNCTKIDSVEGFTFFETSGDFTVSSGGNYYFVRASAVFAYFSKGTEMVAGLVASQAGREGMPERMYKDAMNFTLAEQAERVFCGLNAPIVEERSRRHTGSWTKTTTTGRTTLSAVTATSRIDSRVSHFVSGFNLPQGLSDLITLRGIALPEKQEVIVIETFIPLNHEVFVFGTFDGDRSIVYSDNTVQLSVSYTDPARD
jgi:hypothetical protein